MLFDGRVHLGLGIGGLIGLVVTETPVADQVDHDVPSKLAPECHRQPDRTHARRDVIRIDMGDGQVEALGNVRGISR